MSGNTFKFETFSERLSKVSIDVFHKGEQQVELEPQYESFFQERLAEWSESVLVYDFVRFHRQLKKYVETLPELLYHKDQIVTIMLDHLQNTPSIRKQLLGLLPLLARDLQEHFYPYFSKVFLVIVEMLDPSDPDLLEDAFSALSYLFKFLQKHLLADMSNVFTYYKQLLGHKREYIQRFAAESFAFLVRKLDPTQFSQYLGFMLDQCKDLHLSEGLGHLLFEVIKGVKQRFHSRTSVLFPIMLSKLNFPCSENEAIDVAEARNRYRILNVCLSQAQKFTHKDHCQVISDCLVKQISDFTKYEGSNKEHRALVISQLMLLLRDWVCYKNGLLLADRTSIWKVLLGLLDVGALITTNSSAPLLDAVLVIATTLHQTVSNGEQTINIMSLLAKLFNQDVRQLHPVPLLLLFKRLADMRQLSNKMADYLIRYQNAQYSQYPLTLIGFMHSILPLVSSEIVLSDEYAHSLIHMLKTTDIDTSERSRTASLWMAVYCMSFVNLAVLPTSIQNLQHFLSAVQSSTKWKSNDRDATILFKEAALTLLKLLHKGGNITVLLSLYDNFVSTLKNRSDDECITAVCSLYFSLLKSSPQGQKLLTKQLFNDVVGWTKQNLASPLSNLRLETIHILQSLHDCLALEPFNKLLSLFESVQTIPHDLNGRSEIPLRIQDICTILLSNALPDQIAELVCLFFIGAYYIKFSAIWPAVTKALGIFSNFDKKRFWEVIFPKLQRALSFTSENNLPDDVQIDLVTLPDDYQGTWKDDDSVPMVITTYQALGLKRSADYTEANSFCELLFQALLASPSSVEENSTSFIKFFIDFYHTSFETMFETQTSNKKLLRSLLKSSLNVVTKLHKLPRSTLVSELKDILTALLMNADPSIQSLALKCLALWKFPFLHAYQDSLQRIIKDDTFRDELTLIRSSGVKEEFKENFLEMLIRILYGKMLQKSKVHKQQDTRRNAILDFLASFDMEHTKIFFQLVLHNFRGVLLAYTKPQDLINMQINVPSKQQLGFLNMLSTILEVLPTKIEPHLEDFVKVLLYLLRQSISLDHLDTNPLARYASDIRNLSLRKLAQIFDLYPRTLSVQFAVVLFAIIEPSVQKLYREHTYQRSGLLECIFVFSKHWELALLLKRSPSIMTNILRMLSAPISPSVLSDLLDFLYSIISLQSLHPDEDSILDANDISSLLSNLENLLDKYVTDCFGSPLYREALSTEVLRQELLLLSQVSQYIKNETQAYKMLNLLMPLLKHSTENVQLDIISNLPALIRLVPDTAKYVQPLSQLFGVIRKPDGRKTLCDLFAQLSATVLSLQPLVQPLAGLNSYSTEQLDTYDYNLRSQSFNQINHLLVHLDDIQALPIVYNYLFFLKEEDVSIRNQASFGIEKLVERVAASDSTDGNPLLFVVTDVIYPALTTGIQSSKATTRRELLHILGLISRLFPSAYKDLNLLANEDPEADFFNNVAHIQLHRRHRSLMKFQKFCKQNCFQKSTLLKIFVPLFSSMLSESDPNLVAEVIRVIGCISEQLNWNQYYKLLNDFLRRLAKDQTQQMSLLKVVCEILDRFHFEVQEDTNSEGKASKILLALTSKILPELRTQMKSDKHTRRFFVALAAVKVIKRLPESLQFEHLPGICHALQDQDEAARNKTRQALLSIATYLGPSYLQFLLQELKGALVKGFQEHVLGYTVYFLLHGLITAKHIKFGDIDYCLSTLLEILLEDIFGRVAEKKEAREGNPKLRKEEKATKAYECFALLARVVSFPTGFKFVTNALVGVMESADTAASAVKLDKIAQRLTAGLSLNSSVEPREVLLYTYELVSKEKAESKSATLDTTEPVSKRQKRDSLLIDPIVKRTPRGYTQANFHIFVELGLDLFYVKLKNNSFNSTNIEHLQMLDPYITLLSSLLGSKFPKVVVHSLKCLKLLLAFNLPSIQTEIPKITDTCLTILKASSTQRHTNQAVVPCLKLLTTMIRDSQAHLSDDHLHFIVGLVSDDLEELQNTAVLALLKAILDRRLVVPEIYDLMTRVSYLLVSSTAAGVRQLCGQLFLEFLLHYPLGKVRLQQHLDYLLNNLSFEYESGREAVLDTLHFIFQKFPQQKINSQAEYFCLPLVVRLANDESTRCRQLVAETLKSLFKALDSTKLDSIFSLVTSWYTNNANTQLQQAASQVITVLFEVCGKTLQQRAATILPSMLSRLDTAKLHTTKNASTLSTEWETTYFTMSALEKLLEAVPSLLDQLNGVWPTVSQLLFFPHAWIRSMSTRLLSLYFSTLNPVTLCSSSNYLASPAQLLHLTKCFCRQLESSTLVEPLAEKLTSNLLFVGVACYNGARLHSEDLTNGTTDTKDHSTFAAVLWFLLRRVSYIARQKDTLHKPLLFRWLAAISTQIEAKSIEPFLIVMLVPIYKAAETMETLPPALQEVVAEVTNIFRQQVGTSLYNKVYNEVHQTVIGARQSRKRSRNLVAAADPEKFLKHKQSRRFKKNQARKRKNDEHRKLFSEGSIKVRKHIHDEQ